MKRNLIFFLLLCFGSNVFAQSIKWSRNGDWCKNSIKY